MDIYLIAVYKTNELKRGSEYLKLVMKFKKYYKQNSYTGVLICRFDLQKNVSKILACKIHTNIYKVKYFEIYLRLW